MFPLNTKVFLCEWYYKKGMILYDILKKVWYYKIEYMRWPKEITNFNFLESKRLI